MIIQVRLPSGDHRLSRIKGLLTRSRISFHSKWIQPQRQKIFILYQKKDQKCSRIWKRTTANNSKEWVGGTGTGEGFLSSPAFMLWVDLYDIAPRRKYCNLTWIQNSDIGNTFYDSSGISWEFLRRRCHIWGKLFLFFKQINMSGCCWHYYDGHLLTGFITANT